MAYRTERPSGASTSLSRPSSASVKRDYAGSLGGLTNTLSDLRKQLVDEQIAQLDYEIEVGTASTEDKIGLYEGYLSGLVEGTNEWFRVSTKVQNLKDSAGVEDFAIAKALYAGNQISSEEYYRILKSRVAEQDVSEKELRQRTTELWNFEQKMKTETTDNALRDSLAQEEMGLITASDRLSLLQKAFESEQDPDRRENLKFQVLTQQKKVYKENLSLRELTVRKGIQEGVNGKEDLLPIYAEKIQTAFTNEDALQAEIAYQSLVKDIQSDYVGMFEKGSKTIKQSVNTELGRLDRLVEKAKREEDVTGLALLYENKKLLIEEFLNSDVVTEDDKLRSSNMLNFLRDTYGMDVDLETGNVINVAPTDPMNIQNIEDALSNPDSSLLVRSSSPGGDSTVKLVRGEKTPITMPDGTVQNFYNFGDNIAVSRIDPTLTRQVVDPLTGAPMLDAEGNPVLAPSLPSGRNIQTYGGGYDQYNQVMQAANQKPLSKDEFKGEYVELYKDSEGNPVRGYIVYGEKFANVLGAQPVEGKPGSFILTTKTGDLPSQKTVTDNKLFKPEGLQKAAIQAGAFVQSAVPDFIQSPVREVAGISPNKISDVVKNSLSPSNLVNTGLKANEILKKIKDIQAQSISKSVDSFSSNLAGQLTSSLFKQGSSLSLQPKTQNVYKNAVQNGVSAAIKSTPLYSGVKNTATLISGAKSLVNKGLSFLGFK